MPWTSIDVVIKFKISLSLRSRHTLRNRVVLRVILEIFTI